ncbi:MAG TPA: PEP-CTERM sorting domain-containing protein, partial [Tepidisphaeraceae bacterium]|nr:PEP-CTERM sorting domain-containing protein [Tepidisphaeraceae bacterium]
VYTDGSDVTFNDTNNAHYLVTLNTTVSPHSTTVSNNATAYTISGTGGIAGTGGLTKSGTGSLTISTVNTYSGNTNVTGGVMTIAAGGSIASNVVNVASGATLNVNGSLSATAAVTANGPVNFGGTTSNTPLTRTIASLTVAPAVTVSITPSTNALTPVTLQTGSLSITGTGKVDVGNNALIAPGSAASALTMIQGGQVVSSSIADSNHALGYITTGGTNFEIRYTLKGDANLSGNVDVGDLGALATSYGITGGMSWANGDFNQDGTVNVADLGALATNYGTNLGTSPSLGGGGLSAAEPLAQAASSGGSAAVPEPTSLGLLSVAAVGLMGRRRRRSASK